MQTVVKKWGNSLALRLPQAIAADLQIVEGATVSLSIEDHTLVVKPTRKRYRLADLLAQMDGKTKRGETDWGKPEGEESW
jgi:antitoxin MazE